MLKNPLLLSLFLLLVLGKSHAQNLVPLSEKLLLAVRKEEDTKALFEQLKNTPPQSLDLELLNDQSKKAFWINIYNALVISKLKANKALYKKRSAFYSNKQIEIAGQALSLDDIEHGILRHSKNKLSLGYLGKIFVGNFEKQNRVKTLDYRIHFALNCGAKSCPPIAFYSPEKLETQLTLATNNFLRNTCQYDSSTNKVNISMIFSWFRADFGGKKGIKSLLKNAKIIPPDKNPSIKFDKYDWDLALENYVE